MTVQVFPPTYPAQRKTKQYPPPPPSAAVDAESILSPTNKTTTTMSRQSIFPCDDVTVSAAKFAPSLETPGKIMAPTNELTTIVLFFLRF